MDFQDKKVAVIGAGIEGISSVEFLSKRNAKIALLDKNPEEEVTKNTLQKAKLLNVELRLGRNYLDSLDEFDIIFRSPSVRPDLRQLQIAKKKGALVTSQTNVFFEQCPAQLVGVTGTKGKGTTSTMIFETLLKAGKKAFLAGNIGAPPLSIIDQADSDSTVVLELSSFQLIDLEKSPNIAVILMITSEHLDWHKSESEYYSAKSRLVANQTADDFVVVNTDYKISKKIGDSSKANKFYFSTRQKTKEGAFIEAKNINIVAAKTSRISLSELNLPGEHNLQNVCAAALTATILGIQPNLIEQSVKEFKGLPHRLQFVTEKSGVKYYDDSASTIPETSIAAINSISGPKVLILGGSSKNSDFSGLAKSLESNNVKAVVLIGEEANKIEVAIKQTRSFSGKLVKKDENMGQIVAAARDLAKTGDVVLLSPGCASFGIFANYKDRGDQFKKITLDPRFN